MSTLPVHPDPAPLATPAPPPSPRPAKADHCGPKVSVKLPVLGGGKPARPIVKSKMGKWRAGALILVHVAFAIHLAHWLSGPGGSVRETVTPVEPSESMQTLETGAINAGFVFFAVTLLSTLIFGRFFCGWACHVVALQDLCGWMMKKIGVHPKPFRSRLLLWGPLALALYMFVWPTFRREVLVPVFGVDIDRDGTKSSLVTGLRESNLLRDINGDGRVAKAGEPGDFVPGVSEAAVGRDLNGNGNTTDVLPEYAELPLWMGRSGPMPGFKPHFTTTDFWETFAHWTIAVPFLFICGFVTVYFLGAKAFCTYGCPYGGFFAPLDRLSPLRIRVNDDCHQCGHCTAVCTSNVRVHEEVRDYGAVVDPGCMKCLDCISVCPNDALSLGLGAPGITTKPRDPDSPQLAQARERAQKRYDLSVREELAIGALFLLFFMGYRGMYNAVPLLMAMGIAMVVAFMVHKAWRVLKDRNVRAPFWQLKRDGRLRPAGVAFLVATLALAAVGVQGLAIKIIFKRGEAVADRLTRTDNTWLAATGERYRPTERDTAEAKAAISAIELAGSMSKGGIAFMTTAAQHDRLSYLYSYIGENAKAQQELVALMSSLEPSPQWVDGLMGYFEVNNPSHEQRLEIVGNLVKRWPGNAELDRAMMFVRETPSVEAVFARLSAQPPDIVGASTAVTDGLKQFGHSKTIRDRFTGVFDAAAGRQLSDAIRSAPNALAILKAGTAALPDSALLHQRLAQVIAFSRGNPDEAVAHMLKSAELQPTVERWSMLAQLYEAVGRPVEAGEANAKARKLAESLARPSGGLTPAGSPSPEQVVEPPSATK